ncbi:sigma-70 family RNA polymerase sigma factor [Maribacter algarum]|uniref:Sigma-70 family RNA polymerase sigma factor n=1 Tax=Maribacter algarum (ex Zhang et al. 2020) TaxID=2578118 RepID=A0A5S3PUS6_9FLAO|nr:sigma-70 family RNA polymerase sigma factor [Maribacter algarum]TMM58668.1 sigma-70 family RNA polymerase sigma factor [Maribacter algarum]
MEQLTDEILMAKVANGNLDLLKILFERHHKHVFNFLHKMCGDRMLSEDITQEVFYKLMKYRTSYNDGKFVSWLFTIARNSLNTHFRRVSNKTEDIETIDYKVAVHEEVKQDYSDLHLAINKLDASDRELVILNRFQEIKYEELAEIVGSTPGAVKTKVSRALKKLRAIYFKNS